MKEVTMLRRENAPHLNFLKKQVEKFEKTKEMQVELGVLYKEYLKKQSIYLHAEKEHLIKEKNKNKEELDAISQKIALVEGGDSQGNKKIEELRPLESRLSEIRREKGELERKLGRVEGMLEARVNKEKISGKCPLCGSTIVEGQEQLDKRHNEEKEIEELKTSKANSLGAMQKLEVEEKNLLHAVENLKRAINTEMETLRDQEREKFSFKVRAQELSSHLEVIAVREQNLSREFEAFENEIREGTALIGAEILAYKNFHIEGTIDAQAQEDLRRKIERIKIKLEDAGTGGHEIVKEFEEVSQRDAFLAKEIEDLQASVVSLEKIMADLKEKIDVEFKNGIKKINVEFQEFFSLMFGGGHGALHVVVENKKKKKEVDEDGIPLEGYDEEGSDIVLEQGIEIDVSLPHKKVKELHALSGGERSLTSIALLFAMSQVNPPPFLVLDETDAALDEANSRKYGDMLEKLSKYSQLIVVTHNRETMSRAGMLYGVTIGQDGTSKLLSVHFDEAVAIAK